MEIVLHGKNLDGMDEDRLIYLFRFFISALEN
jgi:hypothetical protein